MRRAVLWASGVGLLNAVAALVVLLLLRRAHAAGWFAYAPLSDSAPHASGVPPLWALVVVPIGSFVMNFVLVLAARLRAALGS